MNNRKGFTLIEMLVVVAIIGLLSSVVVVGLSGARLKARDAKRLADIQQIMNSAEIQFSNAGYPATLNAMTQAKGPQGENYYYAGGVTSSASMACMESSDNGATAAPAAACAQWAGQCTGARQYYFCKTSAQ